MNAWDGWPYSRAYLLLVALAFVVIGVQVFLLHWRAAFKSKTMYGPVVLAPLAAVAGVVGALTRTGAVGWAVATLFGLAALEGVVGTFFHLQGVARRVGGFTLRNLVAGPPFLLPVAFGSLGVTGALAVMWQGW